LWPELIAGTTEWALETGARMLVVDSFATLAGLQAEHENDAAAVTNALKPLEDSAGKGLAVLFLHHANRQGRARGSTAFGAAADIAIQLVSKKNTHFVLQTEEPLPQLAGKAGGKASPGAGWLVQRSRRRRRSRRHSQS
jgi:hypothetical protein